MTDNRNNTPATVARANESKQAGDNRAYAWTEPSVWTKPMLKALEQGVHSILTKVNYQLESRMRENCTYGSEGGEAGQPAFPTPINGVDEKHKSRFTWFFPGCGLVVVRASSLLIPMISCIPPPPYVRNKDRTADASRTPH
jgi:hypothetical protein